MPFVIKKKIEHELTVDFGTDKLLLLVKKPNAKKTNKALFLLMTVGQAVGDKGYLKNAGVEDIARLADMMDELISILGNMVTGWKDVKDESGKNVDYSVEALMQILDYDGHNRTLAIISPMMEFFTKAEKKKAKTEKN